MNGRLNSFTNICKVFLETEKMEYYRQNGLMNTCYSCNQTITEKFLLKALDKYWHEDCLRCACCDCRLGEIGCKLYTKANLILCKKDYLRLFGHTGNCGVCQKLIQAHELVMKVNTVPFHLECFRCTRCKKEFCIGDQFYMHDTRIYCETDYVQFK